MGKGNAILGYARGKVGSVVFTRIKGQQIIKGHNNKPHNRKSRKQIMHRARLSTLYKATRQMPPGFLDGGFEDIRPHENWQACFVRHNTDRAIMQPKDWVEDTAKNCFGKFLMSWGSLNIELLDTYERVVGDYLGCWGINLKNIQPPFSLGQLSRHLIAYNGLAVGDVVTFLIYDTAPPGNIRDPRYATSPFPPQWLAESFRIDPDDTRLWGTVLRLVTSFNYSDDQQRPQRWLGGRVTINTQPAVAIVVTRQEGKKTLCNTAELAWPGSNQAFWDNFESESWVNNVLRSWGVSRSAILNGGGL